MLSQTNPVSPALNLTLNTERVAYAAFASQVATPQYRGLLAHLYSRWHEYNASYFDGQMQVPHLGIGRTSPRRLSMCRENTNYGGALEITLSERAAFGTDARLIRHPWPAPGTERLLDDLLLCETVKQSVIELRGTDEEGWGGYGPRYCEEATRIGQPMGLGEVSPRRRGFRGAGEPVAAFWPWAYRPEDYYEPDVRLGHLRVSGLSTNSRAERLTAVPGIFEYLLYLTVTNQYARLTEVLGRQVDAALEARSPAVAAFERSPHDPTGMPLPIPVLDPNWLTWNGGCVRAIAEGIRTRRAWDGMPILADALQEAGCEDQVLLTHCRAHCDHTASCWAVKLLTEPAQS